MGPAPIRFGEGVRAVYGQARGVLAGEPALTALGGRALKSRRVQLASAT